MGWHLYDLIANGVLTTLCVLIGIGFVIVSIAWLRDR